ncbi:MAG: hypothetical protein Pg6A_03530 [Termitinemataceae bacterium]|nr:MAG: hypothetical protein Pg6A_03530 [Termitinemataceae bacterium]
MNTRLLAALKIKIMSNGEKVLDDAAMMGQFFAEQCAEEPKPEVLALIVCLAAGYHKELRAAAETERARVKQTLAMRLHDDEGLDPALCNTTLELLCAALFGEGAVPETPPVTEKTPENAQTGLADAEKEIERLKNIIAEKNKEMKAEIQKAAQSSEDIEKIKKTCGRRKGWLIAAALALGCVLIFGIVQCTKLQQSKSELYNYESLINEYESLINERELLYKDSKRIWIMNVIGMEVGNYSYQKSRWITKPGIPLKASDVRYLNPVFLYDSPVTSWKTFYIKIIEPSGIVVSGHNSPEGFSYDDEFKIKEGSAMSFNPGGFGNESGYVYSSGTYTIELWCQEFCLYSGTVTLE